MKFRFLISESLGALKSNLLRSFLTIIGIVVGIFSVTAMLALGQGLSDNVLDRFNSFVQGDLTIEGEITDTDYAWIKARPYVTHSLATMPINGLDVIAFGTDFSPTMRAVIGDYADVQSHELIEGEVFDFIDSSFNQSVTVVSNGFAETVLEETGQSILNQKLTISGQAFTVIGVIESNTNTFTRGDGLILLPRHRVVGTLTNTKNFSSVAILLQDSSYFEIAGQHILASLNASRQLATDSEDIFQVETAQSFIETAEETTGMIGLFLGLVGGIALFVGGIGTMNMMLTTVTERTKEIGLRKAVGARNRDIMLQILIESILLTTFGGLLGILLSFGVAKIVNQIFADSNIIKVLVNVEVVLLAAFVAIAVGVVFGLYPARNAAKLQPVDALRAE